MGGGGIKLTFQTALRFSSTATDPAKPELGAPKPSYAAFKVPLYVAKDGKRLTIWGGVRGVPSGRVDVLNRGRKVKTVSLKRGYFLTRVPKRAGPWQLRFGSGVFALESRVAKPVKVAQKG